MKDLRPGGEDKQEDRSRGQERKRRCGWMTQGGTPHLVALLWTTPYYSTFQSITQQTQVLGREGKVANLANAVCAKLFFTVV